MGIRKVGEEIKFEDMIEGDIVKFVSCEDEDRAKLWGCVKNKQYNVKYDGYGDLGPILNGDTPQINTHEFVFKLVKPAKETVMTPEDLKSGMLVEFHNGRIGIVVDDRVYDDTWSCITQINDYNESFINTHDTHTSTSQDYDMVSVYSKGDLIHKTCALFSTETRELLWKRKSESQERMEAIEKQMRELADELESIRNREE